MAATNMYAAGHPADEGNMRLFIFSSDSVLVALDMLGVFHRCGCCLLGGRLL